MTEAEWGTRRAALDAEYLAYHSGEASKVACPFGCSQPLYAHSDSALCECRHGLSEALADALCECRHGLSEALAECNRQDANRAALAEAETHTRFGKEQAARAHGLALDSQGRKDQPMARGLLDYFPDALAEVSELSRMANEKHNPGEEMHWSREKSADHADTIVRHLCERGRMIEGEYPKPVRHSVALAWRALALVQVEIEQARGDGKISRGSK